MINVNNKIQKSSIDQWNWQENPDFWLCQKFTDGSSKNWQRKMKNISKRKMGEVYWHRMIDLKFKYDIKKW